MITFINLMCKGNIIIPTTQFAEAEFTKEGTAIITDNITATLPPTFLPQEIIFAKSPPLCLYIIRWEGRGREEKEKRVWFLQIKVHFL